LVPHYLGPLAKVLCPLALLYTKVGDQLPLKGEVPTHLAPLEGQVHNTLTPWLELILPPPLQMPYLASLNILDLNKLTNDPILHEPTWPAMPAKLPSDIPKFEGKAGDDPANHVMTFHLWCFSNNIMDDSIRMQLFQRTLTGPSAKWYVDEKSGSHATFESLAKAFLTFFQLPICHDNGLNYSIISNKTQPHISLITFTSGVGDIVCAKQKPPNNSVLTSF
jgi:hypothetical protein